MRLAFYSGTVQSIADIEAAVSEISDSDLRDATGVVLRTGERLWQSLQNVSADDAARLQIQRETIRRRIPFQDIYLLPEPSEICAAHLSGRAVIDIAPRTAFPVDKDSQLIGGVSTEEFREIRSTDLSNLLIKASGRCVMRSSSTHHFSLPSGAHTSQFLRLAEAFISIRILDHVAYWVALEMTTVMGGLTVGSRICIVVDNPSMLGLAGRVDLLAKMGAKLECLPNYPDNQDQRVTLLDYMDRSVSGMDRTWFLIGVASTGKLRKWIEEWARHKESVAVSTMVIYALKEIIGTDALCRVDLPGYEHSELGIDCKLCESSSAVPIDSSTYFFSSSPIENISLDSRFFGIQRPFLSKYGAEKGVLRVHYDDPNEKVTRHHAYYVDVSSLLKNSQFIDEIKFHLKGLNPIPDLIVGPTHQAAVGIGALATEVLGRPFYPHDTLRLETTSAADQQLIEQARNTSSLLIVDDLLITGSRLNSYNRSLREQSKIFHKLKDVTFITMMAVTDSAEALRNITKGLTSKHTWTAKVCNLYQMPLPYWHSADDCPWCREQKILMQMARKHGELDTPFDERISVLTDIKQGLADACIHVLNGDGDVPTLGAESPVLPAHSSLLQVLFACASAIQQLRVVNSKSLDPDSFPVSRQLARRVLADFYTERLLWLGILRALKVKESAAELKRFVAEQIATIESDKTTKYARRELALAGLMGHMGMLDYKKETRDFFERANLPLSL